MHTLQKSAIIIIMIDPSLLATKLLAFLCFFKLMFLIVMVQVSAAWHAHMLQVHVLFHNHMQYTFLWLLHFLHMTIVPS